jgi:DNA repair exonuclease SbcCD ATPase subunit
MSGTTGGSGGGGGTVSTKGTSTTSVANLITYAAGSLSDLEHQLSELQQKLKDGLIPADQVEDTKIKIEDLKDEIMKKKILLGLEIDPNIKNAEEARQHILKQVEEFFANSSTPQRKVSSFDTAVGNNPFDESTISGIENLMDWNDSLIEKLQETRNTLESLKTALVEAGLEGSEAF